jgi:hypothetical protein
VHAEQRIELSLGDRRDRLYTPYPALFTNASKSTLPQVVWSAVHTASANEPKLDMSETSSGNATAVPPLSVIVSTTRIADSGLAL